MTKILLFNGPPRSGKDTSALTIERNIPHIGFDRFAMPLKLAFAAVAGAKVLDKYGTVEPYESTKGEIIPWLGVSYRQWQIDFSEKFMKPLYGDDIFARLFVQRNKNFDGSAIVVPDSGFYSEAAPVAKAFGEENTLLVRIHRPGFDFTGDSRSYLYSVSPNEVDVYNDGTQEEFERKIFNIVNDFIYL